MSSSYIYKMLGSSPARPMQQHMVRTLACVSELAPLFAAVADDDDAAIRASHDRIIQLKREADTLKRQLRLQLPKGKFLPVSRRDLLGLLAMQDLLASRARDISAILSERAMHIPAPLCEPLLALVRESIAASTRAHEIIDELDGLLEQGLPGTELRLAKKLIRALNDIEDEIDLRQHRVRSALFSCEDSLGAVDLMFLYQISQWVGELADIAQRIGGRLQLMLSK